MDDAAYERQRQANIAANLALLQSLGLSSNKKTKKVVPRPKTKRLIPSDTSEESQERRRSERNRDKRKRTFHVNSESSVVSESGSEVQETRPIRTQPLWKMYKPKRGKVAVTSSSGSSNSEYKEESVENDTRRRSGRVRKTVLYSDDIYSDVKKHYGKRSRSVDHTYLLRDFIVEDKSSHDDDDDEEYSIRYVKKGKRRQSSPLLQRQAQRLGNRIHNPKRFGQIPGVPVGSWWATRMDCSTDAVHAPTVAGISGTIEDGCYSLALSGGYADDIDLGESFTYTGSGGRQLQGFVNGKRINLRTAPQTFNQSFKDKCNAALLTSSKTRKPIRVIRGYKGSSEWSPLEGYLYSGLYVCTRAWLADGLSGYKVCKYAFKRLSNQDPLPIPDRSGDESDRESSQDDDDDDGDDNSPSPLPVKPKCNHPGCRVEVVISINSMNPLHGSMHLTNV